jgi:phosphoribosylanthranilate isomerase
VTGQSGVQVKICGVCSAADAALAAAAGASYVGVILAPGRPRTWSVAEAAQVLAAAARSQRVGVFVDAAPAEVLRAAERLRLDVVQLHGDEAPGDVASLADSGAVRVWKAVRVREPGDITAALARYGRTAHGLLLDGWSASGHGGVGAGFDWHAASAVRASFPPELALIVAGGLSATSVGAAIGLLRPDVVDVSSGVEETLCRKSAQQVRAFIEAAHAAAEG